MNPTPTAESTADTAQGTPTASAKKVTPAQTAMGCGCLVIALIVAIFALRQCWPSSEETDLVYAHRLAQRYVKERLRSPSTASFGKTFEQRSKDCVVRLSDREYLVTGWVDAQNAFGATMRTNWECRLRQDDTDDDLWHLVSVQLDE